MNDLTIDGVSSQIDCKWSELESLGTRKRLIPLHPLKLYVSRSQTRNRIFQFETTHSFKELKGVEFKNLAFDVDATGKILSIELTDESHSSTYQALLNDLVWQTAALAKDHAQHHLVGRLGEWTKLFARVRGKGLSDAEALGLRGELQLLKSLLQLISNSSDMVESWRGPNGDKNDIGWGNARVEIKAKRATSKPSIIINGADQLTENPGTLFLYVAHLNSGAEDGNSIKDLVAEINELLAADLGAKQVFESKLMFAGLFEGDPAAEVLYQDAGIKCYLVKDGFPRIVSDDIPNGVSRVSYEIDLGHLSDFYLDVDEFWTMLEASA